MKKEIKNLENLVDALGSVNALNIRIYKTNMHTPLYDYQIIASVSSSRQMNGLITKLHEKGYTIRGCEGRNGGDWLLVDLNDVIINLFTDEERERYDLDKMWANLDEINPVTFEEIIKR